MPNQPRDYDMHDSHEFERWPNLKSELIHCRDTVGKAYRDADHASIRFGRRHKQLVWAATACGTLAVLGAIVQLTFHPLEMNLVGWGVKGVEAGAAFVAAVAVIFGIRAAFVKRWLLERVKAEHCRYLKFVYLTRPTLWTRRDWLRDRVRELGTLNKETLERWAEREDDPFDDVPFDAPANIDMKVEDLVSYYREKRLRYQRSYFEAQAQRRHLWERFTSLAPVLFFFGSILAALGHFIFEMIAYLIGKSPLSVVLDSISLKLIFLAACLPVLGAAFRTWGSAHEFGRNVLRFRATAHELGRREAELQRATSSQAKLAILQKAEQVLEAERREWLRLMIIAEWYG
jgi:hypothetical protein